MNATPIERGFDDPVIEAQQVFRTVLDAMARPCRITTLPTRLKSPPPLLPTAAAVLLALADYETSIWLDETLADVPAIGAFLRFHTGARLVPERHSADFAVIGDPARLPPLATFAQGTPEYPDRSTTLIIQVDALVSEGWSFRGPGIPGRSVFSASPLPIGFSQQLAANRRGFPCGVDLVFVTSAEIATLPRSTRIDEGA
jgi:alpha-D-ribose 1-methylphosphonate 5-triphosphate synthase subunit PhnH